MPTPIFRESLQKLKLYKIIKKIYDAAITHAESNNQTIFQYKLPEDYSSGTKQNPSLIDVDEYYIKNMDVILSELQILFPDSTINYKKSYAHYIVIDWS